MEAHKTNWPALERAAFLIEHNSIPIFVPRYCAEAAQLASMMAALRQDSIGGCDGGEE